MKNLYLLVFLISNVLMFGQTKSETQQWLRKIHLDYRTLNKYLTCDIMFKDGYVYMLRYPTKFRVKIKDIKKIKIQKHTLYLGDTEGTVILKLLFEKGKFESNYDDENNFKVSDNDDYLKYCYDSRFMTDDMKERVEKAYVHLVKLYGGSATVYKEPF